MKKAAGIIVLLIIVIGGFAQNKTISQLKADIEKSGNSPLYVKDVLKVCYWLMQNQPISGIYNLGTGKARTFDDLVNKIMLTSLQKGIYVLWIERGGKRIFSGKLVIQ